ncbi:unnamed protein product [Arabis nemorensis]|uniref:Uncharacterized protein n=1 Tax=Arabis nemorensis TaxID=586526 RepID=A0A565BFM6_9BRAS|nr:unnamed protein product [Arabis nemorensis]
MIVSDCCFVPVFVSHSVDESSVILREKQISGFSRNSKRIRNLVDSCSDLVNGSCGRFKADSGEFVRCCRSRRYV